MPQSDQRRDEFAEIMETGNFIAPGGIDESIYKEKKWSKLVAAIRSGWLKLPKPVRATVCILVCMLLMAVVMLYLCRLALPQISPETALREEARKYLAGPMEIRQTIELSGSGYDRLILAENASGVAAYRYHSTDLFKKASFKYYEKSTSLTFIILPMQSSLNKGAYTWTSVIALFDSHPTAVRAELKLYLYSGSDMRSGDEHYNSNDIWVCVLEAQRENDGYFLFDVTTGEDDDTLQWKWKKSCLQGFINNGYDTHSYSYRLYFYDVNGDVVMRENGVF